MQDNAASLRPPRQRLFLVVAAFLALIVNGGGPGVEACTPPDGWRPMTDIELVTNAEVVLYAQVREVFPYSSDANVYTANVEVYCIMKGARTDQFLNISDAGA